MSAITPYNTSNLPIYPPPIIPGLALWLDAADVNSMTITNNTMKAWKDKSSNNLSVTFPVTYPPYNTNSLNGLGTVTLNNNLLQATLPFTLGTSNYSIMILFKVTANTSPGIMLGSVVSGASSNSVGLGYGANYYNYFEFGVAGDIKYTLGSNVFTTLIGVRSSGSNYFYVNGNSALSNVPATLSINSPLVNIGAVDTRAIYMVGQVAEVLLYSNAFTTNQRQQVEGYLAWKWGLQNSLPTSHPFYNEPYLPNTLATPYLGLNPVSSVLPNMIPGCALWLDAADASTVVLSGSNVTQWNDKSGLSNNTKSVTGIPKFTNNALNGYPSISFNGSSGFFGPASNTTSNLTGFFVGTMSNGVYFTGRALSLGNAGQFDYNTASNINLLSANTPPTICWFRGNQYVNYSISYSVPFIYCATFNGISGSLYYNGSFKGSNGSTGTFNYSIYGIGIETGSDVSYWLGNISEVIIYNSSLTTIQRQQIEGYLAWKWGLQKNLPPSHPAAGPPLPIVRVGTSSYQWQPNTISGLALWLDAADASTVIKSGANVTQWNDKSGYGNNATQATSSNQPFLTSSGILFNGAQNLNLANPNALASNTTFSIFCVEQRASSSNTNHILAGTATQNNQNLHFGYVIPTAFRLGFFANDLDYTVPNYSAGNEPFRIWCATQSNTGRSIYLNGSFGSSNNNTTLLLSWNGGNIGKNPFSGGTNYYYGIVKEIIFFKPSLSNLQQQQQVEGYLAWKWGLQKSLPSSHPYVLFPPG